MKIPIPPIPPARRRLAWLPLLASAVSAFAAAPNIVFILADDLGYGDVGALNPQGKIATPQLDRLASRGMVFTEAHSTSAVCSPSRYSILTGRYNWRSELKSGVLGGFNRPLIEPGRLTVAQMLRAHGYHTAVFGKWHLGLDWVRRAGNSVVPVSPPDNAGAPVDFSKPFGGGPTTLGFDEFFGISASLDMPPYAFLANDRVTSLPAADQRFSWTGIGHAVKYTRSGPTAPDFDPVEVLPAIRQHAVEYVGAHAAEARAGHPFFLYLPLNSPHTPIAPTKAWRGKSGLNDYADFVMETDAAIGEVLVALERAGVADNTLVLFASDNGCSPEADFPFLAAHAHDPSAARRGYKADIYDGGHRVPFLAVWPGRIAAGTRTEAFASLGDFMATCADVIGAKLPADAAEDSVSLLPVMLGRPGAAPRDTLVLHSNNGSFGIRQGRWKLELCPDSGGWSFPRPGKDSTEGLPRFQLFDVVADPAEKTNRFAEQPAVVDRLGRALRDIIVNGRSTPGTPQKNTPTSAWPQAAWLEQFK